MYNILIILKVDYNTKFNWLDLAPDLSIFQNIFGWFFGLGTWIPTLILDPDPVPCTLSLGSASGTLYCIFFGYGSGPLHCIPWIRIWILVLYPLDPDPDPCTLSLGSGSKSFVLYLLDPDPDPCTVSLEYVSGSSYCIPWIRIRILVLYPLDPYLVPCTVSLRSGSGSLSCIPWIRIWFLVSLGSGSGSLYCILWIRIRI